jgi:hypothetical protein
MSDSYLPVKILSKRWKKIEFSDRCFADGTSIARSIPNDILLDELVCIPQSSDFDPLGLQNYRNKFLPQKYDYYDQIKLRSYSNNLVEILNENLSIHKNQCEVDKFLRSFCIRHNVNYENHRYDLLLRSYCMNILSFRKQKRDDKAQLETLFDKIYGQCKTGTDFMKVNLSVNPEVSIEGVKIFDISIGEMMDELAKERSDINFINKIYRLQNESEKIMKEDKETEEDKRERDRIKARKRLIKEWEVIKENQRETKLVEYLRTLRFSELDVAMRGVESLMRLISWRGEIQEYNQAVKADSERSRKKLREQRAVPCLRQCLFCYRFKLRTGKISLTCGDRKCKDFEKEILDSIGKENHKYLRF